MLKNTNRVEHCALKLKVGSTRSDEYLRELWSELRALFFLAYSGLVYAAGRKKKNEKKKHTEHERVQFLGTTEHERGPYMHATRHKTHTEHERVQF